MINNHKYVFSFIATIAFLLAVVFVGYIGFLLATKIPEISVIVFIFLLMWFMVHIVIEIFREHW